MRYTVYHPEQKCYSIAQDQLTLNKQEYYGEAIEFLASIENVIEETKEKQKIILARIDELQQQGRQKSHQFHEFVALKLMNQKLLKTLGVCE